MRRAFGEERLQLLKPDQTAVVRLEFGRPLQLLDDGAKGAVGVIGRALIAELTMRLPGRALRHSGCKAGFPDACLARNQHDLPFALPGDLLSRDEDVEFGFATDEGGHSPRANRLEAGSGRGKG